MPPLLVIPALPRTADAAPGALPAMPALSELLRLADAADPDSDWRNGMLRDLGAGMSPAAQAVVAAAALPIPAGRGVCLAAPVHAVAGMSRVHLHAAGVLKLTSDERAELTRQFVVQFGPEPGLRCAGNQWLLEADFATAADETDPAEWAGAPLERQPASSGEQRLLRRLGAEIEMWLASVAVNASRRRRGELPVNHFWLWGGGRTAAPGQLPGLPAVRIHGPAEDAWLDGCAALAGGAVSPLPSGWRDFDAARGVVVLPACTDAAQLLDWESDWFAPALEDIRAGRVPLLHLRLGRRMHRVRPGRMRRLLRRSRPWWQGVGN